MKTNIFALALAVAASTFATGCGDRFQEELPWMVGSQDQMDNDDDKGLGATDITARKRASRRHPVHAQLFP